VCSPRTYLPPDARRARIPRFPADFATVRVPARSGGSREAATRDSWQLRINFLSSQEQGVPSSAGMLYAWVGQIVTFFAYNPPSRPQSPQGSLTPGPSSGRSH
jgi:hypothetical protein